MARINFLEVCHEMHIKCYRSNNGLGSVIFIFCSILDQQQKQSIPFQGGQLLGEFDGKIFVSTSRDIYALMAVPLPIQVNTDSSLTQAYTGDKTLT